MKKLLLFGYFGHGNFGDDLLLWTACLRLGRLVEAGAVEITITADAEYGALPIPHGTVHRKDLRALAGAIKSADVVCAPGGGLFQDKTSLKSLLYYLNIVRLAKKYGKVVALPGQGIGPISSRIGGIALARAFRGLDYVSVRDSGSLAVLESLKSAENVRLTADLTFALGEALMPGEVRPPKPLQPDTVRILVCPKSHGQFETQVSHLANALHAVKHQLDNSSVEVKVASLHAEQDAELARAIAASLGCELVELGTADPIAHLTHFEWADTVLSYRLHGCIMAAQAKRPFVAVSYDPKVSAVASAFGQVDLAPAALDPKVKADAIVASYRLGFDEKAKTALDEMRAEAESDIGTLNRLLTV